jgi:hypothetical protein
MKKVTIIRYANDPVCPRVSAGGGKEIGGYYCTYRGTREEAIAVLEAVLIVMQHMPEQPVEPEMPPKGGQFSN